VDLAVAVFSCQWSWTSHVERKKTNILLFRTIGDLHRHHDESYDAGRESRTFTLPLRYASMTGLVRVTEKLLHEWPNIDRHDRRWSSALVKSSKLGYYDIVKLLVEAGCEYNAKVPPQDFDVTFPDIGTTIEFAAYEGHVEIVHLLLKHQAELGGKEGRWGSALEAASTAVVKILSALFLTRILQSIRQIRRTKGRSSQSLRRLILKILERYST
jgi:hypothetical protein